MQVESSFRPRNIALALGLVAVYFAAQSLAVEYVQVQVADSEVSPSFMLLLDLFSVNAEQTIPTWYSATLLFLSAACLGLIAAAKRAERARDAAYWIGLAAGFLYLSVDESAVIHEILADWLQQRYQFTGYLAFAWQIVAVPLAIVIGVLYVRFLFRLPSRTRNLFVAAGALYLGGALALDAVGANEWDASGGITFRYLAVGTAEELLEMLGVVVFLYALLAYMGAMRYTFVFGAQTSQTDSTPAPADGAPEHGRHGLFPALRWRPLLIGIAALGVGANLALLYWASTQDPALESSSPVPVSPISDAIDALAADGVIVTRIPGRFVDNPAAHRVVASLLAVSDGVMVVTLIPAETSYALTAGHRPFDKARVVDVLHTHGVTEFVIFDSAAVKVIVGAAQAAN